MLGPIRGIDVVGTLWGIRTNDCARAPAGRSGVVGSDGQRSESTSTSADDHANEPQTKPGRPSHTAKRKDDRHTWLFKKQRELNRELADVSRQIAEGLGADVVPVEADTADDGGIGTVADDKAFREEVLAFEQRERRFPLALDAGQAGYDVDSYSHEVGHPSRALVRRIEVKGKGTSWKGNEIVELSDRQFKDALNQRTGDDEPVAPDFDYWLYVVETSALGRHVLPIRNPARRAAKYEFRGGVWRTLVERGSSDE